MSKLIENLDGPVLGINSSKDMHQKLKYESLRLQENWKNPYDAFNFLVTAWHLFHDWPKSDKKMDLSRIKRQGKQLPAEMLFVLNVVKDLTNGSKHFSLEKKAANKRVVSEIHTGNEVGWYQYYFRENLPGVNANDSNCQGYFSIRVLHNIVIYYFEWVFDDSLLASNFPNEIVEAIRYSDIANRPKEITQAATNVRSGTGLR
ncbi:MAG: hypothetical protein H7Z20_11270 [Bdellovibrio sp.]|nr:hypothetical protein [Methylotenera sp.]